MDLLHSNSQVRPATRDCRSSLQERRRSKTIWVSSSTRILIHLKHSSDTSSALMSPKIYDIYVRTYGRSISVWGTMPVGWTLPKCRCFISCMVLCSSGSDVFWHWILSLSNISWQVRCTKNQGMHVISFQPYHVGWVWPQQWDTTTNVSDVLSYLHSLGNMSKDFYLSFSRRATSWKKGGWAYFRKILKRTKVWRWMFTMNWRRRFLKSWDMQVDLFDAYLDCNSSKTAFDCDLNGDQDELYELLRAQSDMWDLILFQGGSWGLLMAYYCPWMFKFIVSRAPLWIWLSIHMD